MNARTTFPCYPDGAILNQNLDVAGYTTVDARLKYDPGRSGLSGSSVGINVKNLIDRDDACYWRAERQIVGAATFRF